METVVDFFIRPYLEAQTFDVIIELVAVVFGIISVYFAIRENILVYPTGIISTAIFIYILFNYQLYGDMIVNVYYTAMSIYGWYRWKTVSDDNSLYISWSNRKDKIIAASIFVFTAVFVVLVYKWNNKFDVWTDYVDTITTGLFFTAMYLMANKKIESWYFWIIANVVSIPLYFYKELGFTAIQYVVFLVMAIQGLKVWKENYNNQKIIS